MNATRMPLLRRRGGWFLPAVAILILIAAPLPFLLTQAFWPRWLAIMALAWWLPGALLVAHWRLPDLDLPAAAALALGLGLCWMLLGVLLIHWLPGSIGLWPFVATYEVGALGLLLALFWRRPVALRPARPITWAWLAGLVLLAALLRLPGIGYHELHIDEVMVIQRAGRAIGGTDDALARHLKGPGEIAISLVVYRALGTIDEASARMPFGLMSVGSVLAVAVLGRRLFSPTTGFWAGVLLTLNGFALGLSRITQYQAAVLLLSALAVWAMWEFSRRGSGRWLALTAIFSAFGLVMHYEFAGLAPLLLVLLWLGYRRAPDRRRLLRLALVAAALAAVLVAAVYVPALFNPKIEKTQDYLSVRIGNLSAFNLPFFVEISTLYNSIYFFVGLVALVVAGLVLGWRRARRETLLLTLWFAPYFLLYIFVIDFPGTHFYLLMESWSLLAALPLAALSQAKTIRPAARWTMLTVVAAWLAVSGGYLYLMFLQQSPEYLANYRAEHLSFYWTPYGQNVPEKPRFGFPMQQGWKVPGTLAAWGCLDDAYSSNERAHQVPNWYMSAARRTRPGRDPAFLFVTSYVQEQEPGYDESSLVGYQRVGEVRVHDEPHMEVWAREPLPVPYVVYDAEDFAIFDRVVPPVENWPDPPVVAQDVILGEGLVLESAGLESTTLARGDLLYLLLRWQPRQALATDYKLFVHLAGADAQPVAQWDGYPCLNLGRTSQWPAGTNVEDHVLMRIPDDVPSGEYRLLVGFYDPASGDRLGGQAIEIATVRVR